MIKPLRASTRVLAGCAISIVALMGSAAPTTAHATVDLLELPSTPAPKAAKALTLNIRQRDNHLVVVGERGIILNHQVGQTAPDGAVKDSEGRWWKQADVPVSVNLTSVAFASESVLFAVGHDGVILRSKDTGATWEKVFDGDDANEQVVAQAKKVFEAFEAKVQAARDAMPSEPTEAQQTAMDDLEAELEEQTFAFEDAEAGARFGPARPMLDVWFKDESTGWVVGSYGQIFETTDGGDSWALIANRLDNPDYRHYNGLYGDMNGRLIISGEAGRVYVSEDFGQSWVRHDTGYIGHLYGAQTLASADGGVAIISYGFAGNVYRMGAGADKWWKLDSPVSDSIVGAVKDGARLVMVDQTGRLIATDDKGVSLKLLTTEEGKPVTGMAKIENELFLSAQGGPRMLKLNP